MKKKLVRDMISDFNFMKSFGYYYHLKFVLDGQLFEGNFLNNNEVKKGYLNVTREYDEFVDSLEYGYYRIKDIKCMSLVSIQHNVHTISSLRKEHEGMLLVYKTEEIK